jgi:hypothetical protein
MADNNEYRDGKRGDSAARTLATIALILSIIALVWAINADRHANTAMDKANSALTQ